MRLTVSAIVAMDGKRGIAREGKIPWHIPEDMRRFRRITAGHTVIMGRKTWETLDNPLPNRTNIVITRDRNFHATGCIVTHSLKDALSIAEKNEKRGEIFIIGGGQIYKEALPCVDKLYLTMISGDYAADTFFPDYSEFPRVISTESKKGHGINWRYVTLAR